MKPFPLQLVFGIFTLKKALLYSVYGCVALAVGIALGIHTGGNTVYFKIGYAVCIGLTMAIEVLKGFKYGWLAFVKQAPTRRTFAPSPQTLSMLMLMAYAVCAFTATSVFTTLAAALQTNAGCLVLVGLICTSTYMAHYIGMRLGWNRAYLNWVQ